MLIDICSKHLQFLESFDSRYDNLREVLKYYLNSANNMVYHTFNLKKLKEQTKLFDDYYKVSTENLFEKLNPDLFDWYKKI